jgi:hypothetical protein
VFDVDGGAITRVRDYYHVDYLLADARVDPVVSGDAR